MIHMPEHQMTRSFRTRSLRPGSIRMGYFLNVDHFHMSEPTFPPHPHAGFSAITVMLPWSSGAFINRDSLGDRSRIGPGSIHWTLAGSGMLHEEIPEVPGQDCEGLQIFVKLPEPQELMGPAAYHLDADEIPSMDRPGGTVQVLVGSVQGEASPIPSHARTTMLLVHAERTIELQVPRDVEAFAVVLRGAGTIDGQPVDAGRASPLRGASVTVEGPGLDLLVAWSDPMPSTPVFQGPFCMFRGERLQEAFAHFRAGRMGSLSPSPVSFAR